MTQPEGKLTGTQLEIMEVVWEAGSAGIKAAEIWQLLCEERDVARTTVLTMVQRLERRGWLRRCADDKVVHYCAALTREEAAGNLAAGFVDEFFAGSASQMVMSLLGSRKIKKAELRRLRRLLDEKSSGRAD